MKGAVDEVRRREAKLIGPARRVGGGPSASSGLLGVSEWTRTRRPSSHPGRRRRQRKPPVIPARPLDPIARFRRWLRDAERTRIPLFDACALATADGRGRPSARFVLLRGVDGRGFVFYTNARSRKGRELRANPQAALAFFWDALDRQVRIEGRVVEVSAAEADAYWATRPRGHRVAAIVSAQSRPLGRREALLRGFREYRGPAARPRHWTGFRVVPRTIEFWRRGAHRLHDREEFRRAGGGWRRRRLQP